jgi:lysophospholipase L1-like esterase
MPCPFSRLLERCISAALLLLAVTFAAQAGTDPASTLGLPHVATRIAAGASLRIVAFGSSSTAGVGASSWTASYPMRLEHALDALLPEPVVVLNQGIGGEDAEDMAPRVAGIIDQHPDLVIWQTGTNDPLRGLPVARFAELTRAGIAAFQAAGIDVMLMGPQLCARLDGTPGSDRYRMALHRVAAESGVPEVRRFELMRHWLGEHRISRTALLSPDGLHMADGGYALLALEVAHEIIAIARPPRIAVTAAR